MRVATFRVLLALSATLLTGTALLARSTSGSNLAASAAAGASRRESVPIGLGERAMKIVARQPFRLVPDTAGAPTASATVNALRSEMRVPELRLTGVVGPPWRALIRETGSDRTTVVQAGDRFGDVTVDSVAPFRVWLRSAGSAWSIPLEVPWQM